MPVTAPLRSSTRADTLTGLRDQALITEARDRAWRRRRRYAAAAAVAVVIGTGAAFAIRADSGGARSPHAAQRLAPAAPSSTRSMIVFTVWNPNNTAQIYRINADGSGLHRLLNWKTLWRVGHWGSWPALSPDGRHVSFQAGTLRRPAIEVANLDGTHVHWVNGGAHPTWSPDGTHIAYSTRPQGIYVERPDGTDWRFVSPRGNFPSWSPDGTRLAYVCTPDQHPGRAHLCVMNADGTGRHRMVSPASYATPAWSPDGTKIAYLRGWPHVHVYVINADGTNPRQLAPRVSYKNVDCGPAWSPNGKQIAFSPTIPQIDGGPGGIYLMDADGRNLVHLKGTTGATCGITWKRTPA